MTFTVRLVTDTGVQEHRDVVSVADGGGFLNLYNGAAIEVATSTIRHIDVFWCGP